MLSSRECYLWRVISLAYS